MNDLVYWLSFLSSILSIGIIYFCLKKLKQFRDEDGK
jgi:hypothetical protein